MIIKNRLKNSHFKALDLSRQINQLQRPKLSGFDDIERRSSNKNHKYFKNSLDTITAP